MRRPSLVLIPILAAALLRGTELVAATPQELEQIRAALLSERPRLSPTGPAWTEWQVSDVGCITDEIFDIDRYEMSAIARECGMEEIGLATEFWQVLSPEDGKGHAREALEATGAALGVPLAAVKCVFRGYAVSQLRRAGASDAEIETWRKRIDAAAEIVGVFDSVYGLGAAVGEGGLAALRTLDGAQAAVGHAATITGGSGTIDRLTAAWYSLHSQRVARFDGRTADAKALVGECRLPEAEGLLTEVHADALDYLHDLRRDVAHYERKVFCDAAGADRGLAVPARISASPFDARRREALRLEAEVVKAVAAAEKAVLAVRRELAEVSRERDAFLAEVDAVVGRYDAARLACDRASLLEQRRKLERFAGHRCASGAGKENDIARAIGRIDRAIGALDDAALPLGTARDEARAALRACRTEAAREAIGRGRRYLEAATSTSPIPLEVCPEMELWFPAAALDAEVTARRTELAGRKQRARDLLAQARVAAGGCRFEEAWGLHEAAGRELGSCTVDASDCGDGGRFDRDLCTHFQLEEERRKAEADLGAAEARFHEASATIASTAQELQAWGREALARAGTDAPERCVALTEVREAAQGLESLAAPVGCPDPRIQAYRDEGPKLRVRAEEIEAGLSRREADLLAAAESAANACDAAALKQALGDLERLQPVSCGRAVTDLGPLRRRLAEVEDLTGQARRILREAEEDLGAWLERCDPSRLATTEARISNLVRCGWESLTKGEQARALVLRDWGAVSAELGRLKSELVGVGMPLRRAVTFIVAAEGRLAGGDRSEESRRALALEKERAAAALAEARAILDRLAAAPLMSKGCLSRSREEVAAGEDRLAGLGDLTPALERDPSAGAATGTGTGVPGAETGRGATTGAAGGTGAPPVALVSVTVPELRGKSRAMAEAWLGDLGLSPVVTTGDGAPPSSEPGRVASQTHAAGSRLPVGSFVGVTVWGPRAAAGTAAPPALPVSPAPLVPPAPAGLTQADCARDWPGAVLTYDPSTGAASCKCPSGSAWSKVSRACLSLPAGVAGGVGGAVAGGDCRHMPGTMRDSRTGECRCAIGTWDASLGRCVDTGAAAREKDVAAKRAAADCENLFSRIKVFRGSPDAVSQNAAAEAEREARSKGCDAGRIAEAKGPPAPPPVGGGTGGTGQQMPPVAGGGGGRRPATCQVTEQPGAGGVTLVYEQTALGNHFNVYVFTAPQKEAGAVEAHWSSQPGFRLVGRFGSYSQGLAAAKKACSQRTTAQGEAEPEEKPCDCVDEKGRRYTEGLGQPCGTPSATLFRDYNCPSR